MTKSKPQRKPIRIGLIGVPGSGKSVIADELGLPWIVDRYAEDLATKYDLYVGPQAQYVSNLFIAQERELRERHWDVLQGPKADRVSCGTLLDTLAYSAAKAEVYAQSPKTDLTARRLYRELAAAQVLSLMMEELWRYTHVFYLPLNEEALIEVPGADPEPPGEFLHVVDGALRTGIMKWRIPAVTLPPGPDRVETILQSIKEDDDRDGNGDRDVTTEDSATQSAS